MEISFTSVAVVAAVSLVAPLVIGLTGLRLPAIVVEILLGIAVGPQALGWAKADEPVRVLSLIGLAFLLLLAGLEIDFGRLRGRLLRVTSLGYALSGGLLQATSLSIPVVAGQIGVDLGLVRPTNYVALVAAGLLSVIVFPLVALTLLRRQEAATSASPAHAQATAQL